MNNEEMSDSSRGSKGRGCLLITALVLLVVFATIAVNFDRLSNLWETGRKELGDLLSLRFGVQSTFNIQDVTVSRQNSSGQSNLIVELQDPSFANMEQDALDAKLKEIATFAHEQYASSREIHSIKIVIARGTLVVKEKREFNFSPDDFEE